MKLEPKADQSFSMVQAALKSSLATDWSARAWSGGLWIGMSIGVEY